MYKLSNNPIFPKNEGNQKGVYVIIVLDNNVPKIIKRILGDDHDGVLYIGQTQRSFTDRVEMFKRVMSTENKTIAHSGALNIKENKALRDYLKNCELVVKIFPSDNPKELEGEMIMAYKEVFGEVPPLNSSN